jgi:hypothetical protein
MATVTKNRCQVMAIAHTGELKGALILKALNTIRSKTKIHQNWMKNINSICINTFQICEISISSC